MGKIGKGSLFHPKIAEFYKLTTDNNYNEINCNYINNDFTYNWRNIEKLLLGDGEWSLVDPVYPKKYEEYLRHFQLLQIVLKQSEEAITQSGNDECILINKLQWLGHENRMRFILQEHLHPSSETYTVENILFLTSVIENALGNVYFTMTKKSPPHLLRDLLDMKELRGVFGIPPIFFLKIIMGSPDSVNLRNIVWHGFPLPSEVPPCYTATLIIVAASLSVLIEEKQISLMSRLQVNDFSRFVSKITDASVDFNLDDIPQIEKCISSSMWTGNSGHKAFWYQIIQHYQNERYWQFIILILPQIELLLRRMYGESNDVDFTAKLEEYYITMNTIFESKDNRLLSGSLCRGTLHLLYDIFISPYGMRVRDKISHGEVNLDCIGKDLCSILLYVGLNLITSNASYPLDQYESRFHLNYLAYDCIAESKRSVLQMMTLKAPTRCQMEFNWIQEPIASLQVVEIIKPVDIFDRHKKEPEIVALLMKIAQLVVQVCANYQVSFGERFQMLLNHELRSRARKTLHQMVNTMTVIGPTLGSIVERVAELNNLMQSEDHKWFEDRFANIQRFCKQTLTILENFARFSDRESNEWLNAVDCCTRFKEVSSHFRVAL